MHLAQINIARLVAPIDDPAISEFVAGIEPINASAERAPGFVWRLEGATWPGDLRVVVNMSVWESLEALREFTYQGGHLEFIRRRRKWFERLEVFLAMWWVPVGTVPTLAEGRRRLNLVRDVGSTAAAFTFSKPFAPDGTLSPPREWPPHTPRG